MSEEDNAGAGHIGTVEFNSATLYRYSTVAVHELHRYLGEETPDAINAYINAFVCSMPTGKQNTFANRTLPDGVVVTLRNDQPINFVGAFEKPVQAGRNNDQGYVEGSAEALANQAKSMYENWLGAPVVSLTVGESLKEMGEQMTLKEVVNTIGNKISESLELGGDH